MLPWQMSRFTPREMESIQRDLRARDKARRDAARRDR